MKCPLNVGKCRLKVAEIMYVADKQFSAGGRKRFRAAIPPVDKRAHREAFAEKLQYRWPADMAGGTGNQYSGECVGHCFTFD